MRKFSLLIALMTLVAGLHAQKVKYKDIFPDLEARKFNKGEPQLKTFLANEKNADHANANYQMGLIIETHFLLQDIVSDTAALFTYGREALAYFRKTVTLITEKELKKHDEYYQSFYRRDLRTGKFGIKISDVHLEIEDKITAIETRMLAVKGFHLSVDELTQLEAKLLSAFNELVTGATSFHDYLMKADLDAISQLGDLQVMFRSFDEKAKETLKIGEQLEAKDYFRSLSYKPIEQFKTLGPVFPLSNSEITTWQFSDWASDAKATLNTEVFVMKNDLKAFDQKLAHATRALKAGTAVNFPVSIPRDIDVKLRKFDPDPLPINILKARINENAIRVLSDTLLNLRLMDSSIIAYQLEIADSVLNLLGSLEKSLSFGEEQLSRSLIYYATYYGAIGGRKSVQQYTKSTRKWLTTIKPYWVENKQFWNMRNNWGVTPTDTIPLHLVDTTYHGLYATKGFMDLRDNEVISWGVKKDSLVGFIAKFGADRNLIWENRFESKLFENGVDNFLETDTLASDNHQLALYLYDENPATETNITIINTNTTGELNWSVSTHASRKPEYTTYSRAIQETTIFLYPQEDYPLTSGELGYIIIGRDGEIR